MITLTYYSKTKLDINATIAEQWREYVTQQSVSVAGVGSMWRVDIQVQPDDSSYRYRALMQKPQLVLKFSLPFYFEFPVGTSCVFQNQRFLLARAQDLKKQGTRKIEYTMTLGTNEDFFSVWKIRNIVDQVASGTPKDNRLKFSLCAKPHEFIELIVRNLNKKDTSVTWECGECIEAAEKTVEFNHTFIDAGLTDICNVFKTEYEVEYIGTTRAKIHLRRVEYFKTEPVALSYGCGNGFIPGVGRTSEADGVPVKRMLVQGSERNIDRAMYGSPELLLPKSQTIRYDGAHFEDEDGFNANIARTYKSNADGDGVERIDIVSDAVKEDSLDCSEIYPSRIGEVTAVEVENAAKNFYNIIDNTIPTNLNFNNYLIAGETMTIIFQDGMLAGKEFDVKYKHAQRKFEIVPQEIDGVMMPDAVWCPVKEQKYAIFGIQLPDEYICNDTNKSGGSWDMMRAAVKALYECEDQRFTFSGTLQSLWAKRHWLEVGGKLIVGGHVLFKDEQFAKDGVVIRIVGVKDFLTSPYSPTIELSNSVSGSSSASSQLRKIDNTEVVIDDTKRDILQFTKRRFRDAKETIEMLKDAQLDMFTNAISPIAVQAMSLLVGDESLQFQFVAKQGDKWVQCTTPVAWDNDKKQLFCTMTSGGMNICLQHYTIGHGAITTKAANDAQGYLTWEIESYASPVLTDASAKYYLYAKCPKDTFNKGTFVLSQTSIRLDEVASHYHFLVGLLNAEVDGERSFVSLHGFTEILPGRITTDRIVSANGVSWIDLVNGSMALGSETGRKLFYNGATGELFLNFLFADGANIANLLFRNQRLESSAGTTVNGVWLPNFFIDGLNNIASFSSCNVVFDKSSAKIGWLEVKDKDFVGYDSNKIERLRLTPETLPPVTSKSTKLAQVLDGSGDASVSVVIEQATSFWAEKDVSQMTNLDDGSFEDNGTFHCWVEIEVPTDMTTLYLGDMQFGCFNAYTLSGQEVQPDCTGYANVFYKNGAKIGSINLSNANPSINIPTAGTIRISFTVICRYSGSDWAGRAFVDYQAFPISDEANRTIIARDGIMTIFNGNYLRMHTAEGFTVKIGNYGLKVTSTEVCKMTDGLNWRSL